MFNGRQASSTHVLTPMSIMFLLVSPEVTISAPKALKKVSKKG